MNPKIELSCHRCGGKTFEGTLEGNDHHVRVAMKDIGTDRQVATGQRSQVVLVCTGCKAWFAFTTVVPAATRWGRELQEAYNALPKEEPCPGS